MKINKVSSIIVLLMVLLCVTSCSKKKDALVEEYPLLNKNHVVEEITPEILIKKISNKESFIVVLGFPKCPWCQALMPVFDETIREKNTNKKIEAYYVNILSMRDNEDDKNRIYYYALSKYLENALVDYTNKDTKETGKRINAPTTIAVNKGELVGYHLNTVTDHVLNESGVLPALTSEQNKQLKNTINTLLEKTIKWYSKIKDSKIK